MGTRTDEDTSFAILDRYAEAGGSFIDTSNNYAFWVNGTQGGESEALLGRWLKSRGVGDEMTIATKLGGRPNFPTTTFSHDVEVQSATRIREAAEESLERLGRPRIDLYYSHILDGRVAVEEQVEGFAALVADGLVHLVGASNHWSWALERARSIAAQRGLPSYDVLQYAHTYLSSRTDQPTMRSPEGQIGVADGNVLSYVRTQPGMTLVAYSPLLGGAYVRDDKQLGTRFDHAGTAARRTALAEVSAETGATPNQVVLSWLIGGETPAIPLVGASSVAQLDETLGAATLELPGEQRARLDAAGTD
ncbi:aldo/keto reductase [Nocardioides sp. LHG3406-4]|uniref:aldo/keto reductase n=1 Tax=Nocardioides sp. LHG3406-4 TaxID=2804575 RepID=UPI003CE78BCC